MSFVPHPLALLAACLALGITAAHFVALPLKISLTTAIITTALAVAFLVRRQLAMATLLVSLAFFCAGAVLRTVEREAVRADRIENLFENKIIASGDPVELTGVLVAAPEPAPEGFYITLRIENVRFREEVRAASGLILLFAPVERRSLMAEYVALEMRYGERVRVMTELEREENYRNPGVSTLTEYLERRGYAATGTIKSPLLVERLDDARVFLPLAWIYEWRQRLLASISEKFSAETAGVLDAALLGDRYLLSKSSAERFRDGGTFHVLVISGLHISFIGGLVWLVARRLTRRRSLQFALSVIVLWAYAIMVGAEATVVRAAFMFTIVTLAPLLNRRAQSLNALGAAAIALLVCRPGDLFDPSFQLTFLSVLMIVSVAWPLLKKFQEVGEWRPTSATPYPPACPRAFRTASEILFWNEKAWEREVARSLFHYKIFKTKWATRLGRIHAQRILRYIASAMLVSACVQVGLLPLLVLYFHRLSFASLVLNIWVGVLMAALSLLTLLSLLVSQLSAMFAAPLFALAETLNRLMVHSV
ncbi:MAG TPA: ComEC family competence protein, partial [Pyrinomonadaceae bacterium]|nr:ComEC family competence protein [Pyrinomonadaceae bacterium]